MLGSPRYEDRQNRAYGSYQQQNRQRQKSGSRGYQGGNNDSQSIFEGIKVAFLTGGSRSGGQQQDQQLIRDFRDHGGRVLDLNKLNQDNYRDALKSLDYLIVGQDDTKLDMNTLGRFSQKLGVPRQEFQNMIRRAQQRGQGFQMLSLNWVLDCLEDGNYNDPGQYQIRMKSSQGGNQENFYEDDQDETYDATNEDTAYTNKYRSRTGGSSRGQHVGHSQYTQGINFDEIREEDLDENNEEDRMILAQLRKSRALRRVGTSSPYRNKDGTIDRRRVKDTQDHRQGAHFDDFNEELDFDIHQDRGVQYYGSGSGGGQRSDYQRRQQSSQGYRSGGGSGGNRGYSQGNRDSGDSSGGQSRNIGPSGQGLRKGEATFVQEDVSNLNPEDFPPEYRNKDGTLDRRRFRHSKVKDMLDKGQDPSNIRFANQKYDTGHHMVEGSYQMRKGGQSQGRTRSQGRSSRREEDEDFEQDYEPQRRTQSRGGKSSSQRYQRSMGRQSKQRGYSSGGRATQGGGRKINPEIDESGLRRNMDGSIDLRQFGPFNVERAPTGQLVPKGTIKDPINKYADSKTKYRQAGISDKELEHHKHLGYQRSQRRGGQEEDEEDQDEDYDQDEGQQQRRGQYRSQQRGSSSGRQRQQQQQQRRGGQRDEEFDEGDEDEHEQEKLQAYEKDHDRRHLGPFNVDRAPTGQFVPKGTVRNPINRYKDSKEKGGMGLSTYPGGKSGQSRRQTRANEDEDQDEDYDQDEGQQQQQRSSRRQGQKRSYQDMNGRSSKGRQRNRKQSQDHDNEDQENQEQEGRTRSRQVPKGLMQTHENQSQQNQQNQKKQPLNESIITQLQTIRDHYAEVNDQGRKIAYNKAITELRNLDSPIQSVDDLDDVENIGQNIKDHIREFLETGTVEGFETKKSGTQGSSGNQGGGNQQESSSQSNQQQQQQNVDDSQQV